MTSSITITKELKPSVHRKTQIVKVSGAEIDNPDFNIFSEEVNRMVRNEIRTIVVYGGGRQISECYGKPRKMKNGIGITTEEILQEGVLPANQQIRKKLRKIFPFGVDIPKKDIICNNSLDPDVGLVGIPHSIKLPDVLLTLVGFVGNVGDQAVNVNSDDITARIAYQEQKNIEMLTFLTGIGGVSDNKGKCIPILSRKRIATILEGNDKAITVNGGMGKKLRVIHDLLVLVEKVLITKPSEFRMETYNYEVKGTMCTRS